MSEQDADHQALREMRDAFVAAYNRSDLDGMLSVLDPEVSFTAMNGESVFGHDGVRAYHLRVREGPTASVRSTSIDAIEADRRTTIFDSHFGVASGWADTSYVLTDGLRFKARLRWTNSMVKRDGVWKIVSVHTSCNVFENPILSMTRKAGRYTALAAAGLGAAAGWFLRRR